MLSLVTTQLAAPSSYALECGALPSSICGKSNNGDVQDSGLWALLLMVVRILAGGVGLTAIAMIVFAGFTYTTAQDRDDQVKKSKGMILNAIIGLALFALMYTLLEWLIPGGIFS